PTPTICPLFLITLPPPPHSSSPFPYMTPFRSLLGISRQLVVRPAVDDPAVLENDDLVRGPRGLHVVRRAGEIIVLEHGPVVDRGDRKSTRLNSSHVAVSYAVFCLENVRKDSV